MTLSTTMNLVQILKHSLKNGPKLKRESPKNLERDKLRIDFTDKYDFVKDISKLKRWDKQEALISRKKKSFLLKNSSKSK